jgi:hypothetical protein
MSVRFFCNVCGKELWQLLPKNVKETITIKQVEEDTICSDCLIDLRRHVDDKEFDYKKKIEKEVRNDFEKLKREKDYVTLGWFFFHGFAVSTGHRREVYSVLWDSMTKEEKLLCEEI